MLLLLLKGSIFLCQSDQPFLYQHNPIPTQFHKLPAEGCPGLLAQHLSLTATAFPCSNTWWLHSEFLQDFGHTRAQESQTTSWRMAVHQQCWHRDKPDSTGKHASSRGQEVDCYHFRAFSSSGSLGQLTGCGYSQRSGAPCALIRILLTHTGHHSLGLTQPEAAQFQQ